MKWQLDVSVLIIFFKRSEQLLKTFNAVKSIYPKRLLLWQDGPRNEGDIKGILECRKIVEQIDWECEVYKHYNEHNLGCDPSTFYSHKWAFSITDKCIVLEDDFVANKSFFYFCKELLDVYENDERINHICGMNVLGEYKNYPYDYFFGYTGTNAWASWKRVIDEWDETYSFLHKPVELRNLKNVHKNEFNRWLRTAISRKKTGVPYWESILLFNSIMNSRLAIIPTRNMVNNIGMTSDSTHSNTQLRFLTKTEQRIFNIPTFEYHFPLKHPQYVIPDFDYYKQLNRFFGNGHPLIRNYRRLYHLIKYIRYGEITKKIKERLFK